MGRTIQFESHRVEAPKIYELEQDPNILEYYDQPPPIKLNYESKNGRNLGVIHTPDFFVIENNAAGWIECKTEEELKKLIKKQPNRYYCDADGNWGCPPGEEYAKQFGLNYTICSDKHITLSLDHFVYLFFHPKLAWNKSGGDLIPNVQHATGSNDNDGILSKNRESQLKFLIYRANSTCENGETG